MSARENILGRIRTALGRKGPLSDAQSAPLREMLRNHPRGALPGMPWEPRTHFKERCESLSSTFDEVKSLAQVPAAVAGYLKRNGLPVEGVCWPEFAGLPWSEAGVHMQVRPAGGEDKVGVTGTYCAIAETGTLMLLSGRPDLASSLLPDTHIAIVPASRILRSMEDAWDLLRSEHARLPRQVAFISGPSRTADIEMTLVLGIHGPYRVHILVVQEPSVV